MKLFKIWNIFDTFCSLVFTTQLLPLSTSLSAVIIADFELYHIPPLFIVLYLEHLLFAFLVVSSCACLLSFLFSCQTVCLRLSPVIICLNHGFPPYPGVFVCVLYMLDTFWLNLTLCWQSDSFTFPYNCFYWPFILPSHTSLTVNFASFTRWSLLLLSIFVSCPNILLCADVIYLVALSGELVNCRKGCLDRLSLEGVGWSVWCFK